MNSTYVSQAAEARRDHRALAVSYLGPLVSAGALVWAILQPYRVTLLHPRGQGFWSLALEPPVLGLVHGRLKSRLWRLTWPLAFVVTGTAFLVHEQNPWLFARSAFLHHLLGWTFLVASLVPLALAWRPRSAALQACFALTILVVALQLFADRDVAPIFGHLSPLAGQAHR